MNVNLLAEIWGISIVVISMAVLIRPKYLTALMGEVENEARLFCMGFTAFVVGLAMVLTYNVWTKDWQVIITILGWISLIKGLFALFLPEYTRNLARKMTRSSYLPYAMVAMVIIGLIITYFGFTTI